MNYLRATSELKQTPQADNLTKINGWVDTDPHRSGVVFGWWWNQQIIHKTEVNTRCST